MNKAELEKLSDVDLNFNLAKALDELKPIPKWCEPLIVGDKMCYYDDFGNICDRHADYCNSWEDMGPLIVECKISLHWRGGIYDMWISRTIHTERVLHENPLRAAAIVYLLMKGE